MPISLREQLERRVRGDVRFDRLARALYATDASIYEIVPVGVVCPRGVDDVVATVDACRTHGVPVVARGAGTGLTGGAVGSGVQVDFSRSMNRILELDVDRRTVRVEPGVVLDALNATLAPHGLQFAPDVATSSRATVGGMIANNSCGAHSVIYGRTVDHVAALTVVLADGSVTTWPSSGEGRSENARRVEAELTRIATIYNEEITTRFPKILRRNGGYALDLLRPQDGPVDPTRVICGSEGTLCLVTEALLKLTPLPQHKRMLLAHFEDVLDALSATPPILAHAPAAVELVDRMVLEGAARDAAHRSYGDVVDLGAGAVLIIELFDDSPARMDARMADLQRALGSLPVRHADRVVAGRDEQRAVWEMRKRGLGMLMSKPGDVQTCAFVEDTAVDPSRLREYIERFQEILREEGVNETAVYAHASVGEMHVRPALNLKAAADVSRMRRIADRVSDLALEFGGAMTGEHGDGIVRSCWLEKMYGPVITRAFAEVKRAFDPSGLMNPGKIVDPLPMTEHLRYGPDYASQAVETHLDFRAYGGVGGLAEMCSGVGQCRQRGVGTMCPSFVATGDEVHTTRARANALRMALSHRGLLEGLSDPALDEVMDLCLMCKACKTECPTGVDMARLKAEWLSHRNRRRGVPRSARLAADAPKRARMGSWVPRVSNFLLQSRPVRAWLEHRYGFDRRVPPPRFASDTFRHWFARRRARLDPDPPSRPRVVYFVDTWTNYYQPDVGMGAVRLLEAAGFSVVVRDHECCGRTRISKGLLGEAAQLARRNVERLAPLAASGLPIVGTEPSCILTLVDEYPQLVAGEDARALASSAQTMETFLAGVLEDRRDALPFGPLRRRILYHSHCHQDALVGWEAAVRLLNAPPGFQAVRIDAGCCGMAGAFGHEKDHYAVAAAIGEERLFPAIRERGEAQIAVSGFSCRHQIAHHAGVSARHVVEHLADALA